MALYKIEDFSPNYRQELFDGDKVKGMNVYISNTDDKIGSIHDVLVDETGRFRYFVVDTGFWIFGKKVLLPIGRCYVDSQAERIYATGLTDKQQAENLPEYNDDMTVDYDYEERVRSIYRTSPTVEASAPVEMSAPAQTSATKAASTPNTPRYDRNNYTYDREPELYNMDEQKHQKLKLYEERLVTHKNRQQTGEVAVGKRVETQTAQASVPVEKERVVIERKTPASGATAVNPANADFQEGEVARMEVYEETADIQKQPFVREEVNIKKEVKRDTVDAEEKVRREELEVDVDGNPVIKQ